MGYGSNLVRPLWIGRLGFNPRGEAAAPDRRRFCPRQRSARLAGARRIRRPGVKSTRVWIGWHLRDKGILLGPKAGLCRGQGGTGLGDGGLARRNTPARGVLGSRRTYWPRQLVKKDEKGVLMLTTAKN